MKKLLVGFFLLSLHILVIGQKAMYQEMELSELLAKAEILMQQMKNGHVLVVTTDDESWRCHEIDLDQRITSSQQQVMLGSLKCINADADQILLGGSLGRHPVIWQYLGLEKEPQTLSIPIPFFGSVVQIISGDAGLRVLVDHDTSYILFDLNASTLVLDQIDQYTKSNKQQKILLALNGFGETYVVSSGEEEESSRLTLHKYDADGQLLWQETFASIPGTMTGILLHPNGNIIGCGIDSKPFTSKNFYVQWAPNGRLLSYSDQDNVDKMQPPKIGWVDANHFWSMQEVVPVGGRMPNIDIRQYRLSDLSLQYRKEISGTGATEMLACTADQLGNPLLIYRDRRVRKLPAKLRFFHFNRDLCDQQAINRDDIEIQFTSPQASTSTKESYHFSAQIRSAEKLKRSDVNVRMFGQAIKAPEITNLVLRDSSPLQYCYDLTKMLYLQPGANSLTVSIEHGTSKLLDTIPIYYLIKRPDLYIFSVGVVYEDLTYTSKDAADFINLFSDQEGRLFNRVHHQLLDTRDLTKASEIIRRLEAFGNLAVKDEDLVLVFFSSHGEILDGEFAILGSDYTFEDPATSVNFRDEIINRLEHVKGKKIMFLDACKSGNLKGATDEISPELISSIFRVVQATPGIIAISSSSDEQPSYEINDLENGVFTAAIKELFTSDTNIHDTNNDRILTVGEVFSFLRTRVPELIKYYFKDPNRNQIPKMPIEDVDVNLPIFYLSNY